MVMPSFDYSTTPPSSESSCRVVETQQYTENFIIPDNEIIFSREDLLQLGQDRLEALATDPTADLHVQRDFYLADTDRSGDVSAKEFRNADLLLQSSFGWLLFSMTDPSPGQNQSFYKLLYEKMNTAYKHENFTVYKSSCDRDTQPYYTSIGTIPVIETN